jgi:hypothetical protein
MVDSSGGEGSDASEASSFSLTAWRSQRRFSWMTFQIQRVPSNRTASTPDFATGSDARREIGSNPAGGDVGSTKASCELSRRSSWQAGRTGP